MQIVLGGECHDSGACHEVSLLDRYELDGDGFVAGLNGLFAGLLIDRARGQAVLFNDRFGSEPLYAFEKDGETYFASEAKALLAVLPELRAFDDTGVAQFLAFGSTLGEHTLFRGLRRVPGGSRWRLSRGAPPRRERYFTPSEWERLPTLPEPEFEARFASTFRELLPSYLRDEQPVGISLTGGLDTRMIVACSPPALTPTVAYTYAAEGGDNLLDLRIAERIAASRGIPHRALRIGTEFVSEFGSQLDRTVRTTDGSAGVLGAHEIYLSEQARRLAPVRLTGNFGSEVLRSMSTFKRNAPASRLLDPGMAARVDAVAVEYSTRSVHPVTQAAFEEVPWHLFGALAAGRSQLSVRTPFMDNKVVELAYRMPPHLRHTPEPALRLIHAGDVALAAVSTDRGLAWPNDGMAGRLRRLWCGATFKLDYWHKEGLPDALSRWDRAIGSLSHLGVLGLHKFLPYRGWFRGPLAPYAAAVIDDARTRHMAFWDTSALGAVVSDHVNGKRNALRDIHAVLTLEAVHRLLIDSAAYRVDDPA